jgi:hypothetical protein
MEACTSAAEARSLCCPPPHTHMRVSQIRAPVGLQLAHGDTESAVNGVASRMSSNGVTLQQVLADTRCKHRATLTAGR